MSCLTHIYTHMCSVTCLFTSSLSMQFESKLLPPEGTADVLVEFRPKELTVFHEKVVFEINGLCKKTVSIHGGVPMKVWNPNLPHNKMQGKAILLWVAHSIYQTLASLRFFESLVPKLLSNKQAVVVTLFTNDDTISTLWGKMGNMAAIMCTGSACSETID